MAEFSDTIVYVDESGNHGLGSPDTVFPVFVLAFCVFRKSAYINQTVPAVQSFKFRHFGHDGVVLHEREIRKKLGPFSRLTQPEVSEVFFEELTEILESQPFEVIACVIDKTRLRTIAGPLNPYHVAMVFCLERLYALLKHNGSVDGTTHVVFEARGRREDEELELEFRRVCDGQNQYEARMPLEIVMANKRVNSSGLQIADLVARPIGLSYLRPDQPNRAYEVIKNKFAQLPDGGVEKDGRKVFP